MHEFDPHGLILSSAAAGSRVRDNLYLPQNPMAECSWQLLWQEPSPSLKLITRPDSKLRLGGNAKRTLNKIN